MAVEATTIDCASIILPMTPPEELAAPIRIGDNPNCSDVIFCRFPNRMFDAVSEPVSATPSHPSSVPKNGYSTPAPAKARPRQIELVTVFADQAVIAIENVRLLDEIQDKNRQLALASENKSQFVSSMSHELRTPLNAIIGLTEMMVTNAARFGTEKAQEPLQRVNRVGTHLLGLINQVLDLSKIEAGKLELNVQTVELAPLIDEVIGTARQLAEQNKNRLILSAQENLGALTVDPLRLRQVLLNLLSNVCKFTKGARWRCADAE